MRNHDRNLFFGFFFFQGCLAHSDVSSSNCSICYHITIYHVVTFITKVKVNSRSSFYFIQLILIFF